MRDGLTWVLPRILEFYFYLDLAQILEFILDHSRIPFLLESSLDIRKDIFRLVKKLT